MNAKTETKSEILNRRFKENELIKEDYFVHSQYTILTRSGIEKIQYKNNVRVRYEAVAMSPSFCVVKAIATKEVDDKIIIIETFGSAGHNANGEHQKGKQYQYLYYPELAEKRALSRAVLKICNFYELGVFGEDEADDFKKKEDTKQEVTPHQTIPAPAALIPDGLIDTIEGAANRAELLEIWQGNKQLQKSEAFVNAFKNANDRLAAEAPIHPLQNPYGVPVGLKTEILLLLGNSVFEQEEKAKTQAKIKEMDQSTEPEKARLWAEKMVAYLKEQIAKRTSTPVTPA